MQELSLRSLQRPEVIASPWSFYARLRREAPVHFDPCLQSWLLTRHADVASALADPRFSAELRHETRPGGLVAAQASMHRALRYLDRHVSFADPPTHTRLRGALAPPLRPGHVRLLERCVAVVVAEALDELDAAAAPDAIDQLAARVPLRVIQQLLGLDGVSLSTLRRWSNAWGDVVAAPGHIPTADRAEVMKAVDELVDGLCELVAEHRRDPSRASITGALVGAVADGALSEDELIANLMMLVTAGSETTANLIGSAVLELTRNAALWERLRADRTLLGAAVEELARVHPPTQYTARTALEDVEVGGQPIARGQTVVLILAAANRDPDVFGQPDVVWVERPNTHRHVAFGQGAHRCFGAPLARMETRLVLDGLLDGERPVAAGPSRWRLNANLRGLDSLPIHWTRGQVVRAGAAA
jgi:cytochrome P450